MDDNQSVLSTRPPNPRYEGQNGFAIIPSNEEPIPQSAIWSSGALDRHRLALHVLAVRGQDIPNFQEMQSYVERRETPATIQESLDTLRREHQENLAALYDQIAEDYKVDAKDFFDSVDESQLHNPDMSDPNAVASSKQLESLWPRYQSRLTLDSQMSGAYSELRHSFFTRERELKHNLKLAEGREANLQRSEASKFPQSSAEFRISKREVQVRIAKFLLADRKVQEEMLDEFGWAWRQTVPLTDEFKKDALFAAVVKSVHQDALNSADPRIRRLSMTSQ